MPEFEDWAWRCEVYRCSVPDVTTEPPADWQDNPLRPYVPPDPASLTGEWVKLADLKSTVPIGCERQPRQYGQASALAVSTADPRILYAGFDRDSHNVAGVWKSVDGGLTWFEARAGLGSEGCTCRHFCENPEDHLCKYWGPDIYSLYVDPIDPDLVFASTWERGLYRTTDGGRSWARVDFPPPWTEDCMDDDHFGPMGPVGRDPLGVYHATACMDYHFASYDLGESWESRGWVGAGWYVTTWAFDPTRRERIWAGMTFPVTGTGWVHLSEDGGHTWRKMSAGIEEECLWEGISMALTICPRKPDLLAVAITFCGLFVSEDGGATWSRVSTPLGGQGDMPVWAGFQPSESGCRLLAGWSSSPYGLFRSDDLGKSWDQEDVPVLQVIFYNFFEPEVLLGLVGVYSNTSAFEVWARE